MSEESYNEGDLVEAVKGESVVRGRLKKGTYASAENYLYVGESAALHQIYLRNGWTVTVIEKAKPPLPTEPGFYVTDYEHPDAFQLLEDGSWWYGGEPTSVERVRHDGGRGLTKLEPVAETAKRVLEAIERTYGENYLNNTNTEWNKVAREFGVTS